MCRQKHRIIIVLNGSKTTHRSWAGLWGGGWLGSSTAPVITRAFRCYRVARYVRL